MTPALEIRGVSKRFGSLEAVRPLDLVAQRGALIGLLGPNGAGKSTLIRMIMSLIRPDTGELRVLGGDALDMKDRIGYLPEERGVYRRMRVEDFLFYIGRLKGLPPSGLRARIAGWLERVELPGVAHKRCQELSKGMQQKVQFVAAVLHDPELIVLDEPFSGLDPVSARVLIQAVRDLHREGRTIFLSTHQMTQAEQLCQRIVLINRGDKILDATVGDALTRFSPRGIDVEPVIDPEQACSALRQMPGVASAQWRSEASSIQVAIDEGADAVSLLAAIAQSVPARRIEVARVSLDDVFVRLVEGHGGHARVPVRGAA
jgi:ABC-2 type transport system ATP-binding protein